MQTCPRERPSLQPRTQLPPIGAPRALAYASGASESFGYDNLRSWLTLAEARDAGGLTVARNGIARTASGRIWRNFTSYLQGGVTKGNFDHGYDYAGRLLAATHTNGLAGFTQSFTYDGAGRMRTNSRVRSYAYANAGRAEHAPSTVTPASGPAQGLGYDLNGNMTTGLDGRVMSYDGENRPVSVSYAGRTTAYVYGADGARLKKVESDPVGGSSVTLYMSPVEIRNYGQGAAEEILLYPQPNIRITKTKSGSTVTTKVFALHADGLGSVRAVTDQTGAVVERTAYRPYGEEVALAQPSTLPESRGVHPRDLPDPEQLAGPAATGRRREAAAAGQ